MTTQATRSALLEAIGLSQAQFADSNGPGLDSAALVQAIDTFEAAIRWEATAKQPRTCTGPCHGSIDTCEHCAWLRERVAEYREVLRVIRDEHEGEVARFAAFALGGVPLRPAPSAPRPTHAANVVGTCDWGDCDGETVGVRLDSDGQWLAVCAQHSPVCRAMDAIWRLTCLPFSDNDRHKIQNIALAWIDGTGPREGSAVAQWLADPAPSAPPASDPDDLPYDDGPEEPWCWGPGSPEHETNQCLHNGRDE